MCVLLEINITVLNMIIESEILKSSFFPLSFRFEMDFCNKGCLFLKIGRKKNQNFLSLQLFELIESNTKKSIHRIVSDNFSKFQPSFLLYS